MGFTVQAHENLGLCVDVFLMYCILIALKDVYWSISSDYVLVNFSL